MAKKTLVLFLCVILNACSFLNNEPKFNLDNSNQLIWFNTEKALNINDFKHKLVIIYFFHFGDDKQFTNLEMLKTSVNRYPDELLVIGVNLPLLKDPLKNSTTSIFRPGAKNEFGSRSASLSLSTDAFTENWMIYSNFQGVLKYEKEANALRNFCMKYAVNFPVVHDERSQIADANGVFTSPAIFILDYDNHIVQEFDEMPSRDEFMTLLKNKVEEYTKKKKLDMNVKSLIFLEKEKLNIERNNELKLNQEEDSSDPTLKSFNLFFPSGLAWNDEKEILAVADSSNHQIKIIDKYSKIIDVIGSGSPGRKDGNFRDASFRYPHNLVFDGTNLVLIDKGNDLLRLINLNEKIVQTIDARQYKGYSAIANFANGFILGTQNGLLLKSNREKIKKELDQFSSVTGLLYAKDIQKEKRIKSIFISDAKASSIYAIARNQVEKLDWNGANLVYPQGLAYDAGKIYVVDTYDNKIKIYDLIQNLVSTLEINIDNCQGDSCHSVFEPSSIVTANYGFEKTLFIADSARHRILKHSIDSNKTEVFYE